MDEVIHSAPWRPGMKSSLVPAALFQRSWNTSPSQTGFSHRNTCLFCPFLSVLTDFPLFACTGGFEMDKDTEIARLKVLCKQYKAAAEKWEREYKIVEKRSLNLGDALYILTAQRSARLNWLYRLGDLHVRIPEDTRIEIGDIIDDALAYENSRRTGRKNATRDESRTSAPMTEAMEATEGHFPPLSMK